MFPFTGGLLPSIDELIVSANSVTNEEQDFAGCGVVNSAGENVNLSVSNGSGSYTYNWVRVSDAEGEDFSLNGQGTATPYWGATRCDNYSDNTEGWRCNVTDTVTGRTGSVTINVTLIWTNIS
jgi:hypothetical protein